MLEADLPVQRPGVNSLSDEAWRRLRQRNMVPNGAGAIAETVLVIKGMITLKKRFETAAASGPPKPTPSET